MALETALFAKQQFESGGGLHEEQPGQARAQERDSLHQEVRGQSRQVGQGVPQAGRQALPLRRGGGP
eukprot:639777-Alexandrium_andersonii.AAC.1